MTEAQKTILLLRILKQPDAGDDLKGSLPEDEAEWQALYEAAVYHNVEALFYYCIKEKGFEKALPAETAQNLRQRYHQHSARNLRLFHELGQIQECLNKNNLPAILLKGAFLAACVYPNPALRSMADIDILMQPQDIRPALAALKGLGYDHILPPWANVDYHAMLASPSCTTRLELHWSLTNPGDSLQIPLSELWAHAIPAIISGMQLLVLNPEDLILHLCEHTAIKHLFMQGVRGLCDIDRTIRNYAPKLNWQETSLKAMNWGIGRATALTFELCKRYLETPIPDEIPKCPDPEPENYHIFQDAFQQIIDGPELLNELPPGMIRMSSEPGFIGKIHLLFKYIFLVPDTPYQKSREMPIYLVIYYLFRRLLFLAANHTGKIFAIGLRRRRGGSLQQNKKWALLKWMEGEPRR